jgi:glutamine synthetase
VLAAGLRGLERGAALAPPVQEDPANLSEEDRARRGIERLPADLREASARFAVSDHAKAVLGEALHRAAVAVQELEWQTAGDKHPDELAPAYRFRF